MGTFKIDFAKTDGIIPAIIQDAADKEVLMLGYMNDEAFDLTVKTGLCHFWSRSKKRIWMKGETSGHTQIVKEMHLDCDSDTLLIKVIQNGKAACHEGYRSCFFRKIEGNAAIVDGERIFNPDEVYKSEKK